jgi:hypothetical protein
VIGYNLQCQPQHNQPATMTRTRGAVAGKPPRGGDKKGRSAESEVHTKSPGRLACGRGTNSIILQTLMLAGREQAHLRCGCQIHHR